MLIYLFEKENYLRKRIVKDETVDNKKAVNEQKEEKMEKEEVRNGESGITLVALVVTIVVLIILATITVNIALNGGIADKTQKAKILYENEEKKEQVVLQNVIERMNEIEAKVPAEDGAKDEEPVSKTENCIGYYADLDGDKKADGIIYADLAIGQETASNWASNDCGVFQYRKVTEGLKEYIKEGEEGGGLGTYKAPMVKEIAGGGETERFYVMALDDFGEGEYSWYYNAFDIDMGIGKLTDTDKIVEGTTNDFGEGKTHTDFWIEIYSDPGSPEKYGALYDNDIWSMLQGKLKAKGKEWFVPTKSEWSAFGNMCYARDGINVTEGGKYGYGIGSSGYWTSSQANEMRAWCVYLPYGDMQNILVNSENPSVRLSTTF